MRPLLHLDMLSKNFDPSGIIFQTNILSDGDMEAVGTAAWSDQNNAIITKQIIVPHSGTRCLRVAYNGTNNASAYQAILTIGKTYRVIGWARSDGTTIPTVLDSSGVPKWTGTNSTSWQSFDVTFVCSGGSSFLLRNGTASGYVEFDDITVQEKDTGLVKDISGFGRDFVMGDGTTTTTFPTKLSTRGMSFDGGDYLTGPNILQSATKFTISCLFNSNSNVSNKCLLGKWDTNQYSFAVGYNAAGNAFGLFFPVSITDATLSNFVYTSNLKFVNGPVYHITCVYDGTQSAVERAKIYVNGKNESVTGAGTVPASLTNSSANFKLGNTFGAYGLPVMNAYSLKVYNEAFTPIQVMDDYLRSMQSLYQI